MLAETAGAPLTQESSPGAQQTARAGHGRNSAGSFTGAQKVAIRHAKLHSGDRCPECKKGESLHPEGAESSGAHCGQAPLAATGYELERLRCNACGQMFTAEEPEEVGPEKYDESTAAMIAQLKYGCGVPFYRLEKLEASLGVPMPAATQWEIVEESAMIIKPALEELIRQAAQGKYCIMTTPACACCDWHASHQKTHRSVYQRHCRYESGTQDRPLLHRPPTCR